MKYENINHYLEDKIKTYFKVDVSFDFAVDYNEWMLSYSTITPSCLVVYDDYNYAENYEGYEDIPSHTIRIIINTNRIDQSITNFTDLFSSIKDFVGLEKSYMIIDKRSKWIPTDRTKLAYEISLVIGESE